MKVPFRLVDVFTDRPLAGNQLCVVPEPVDGLDTEPRLHRGDCPERGEDLAQADARRDFGVLRIPAPSRGERGAMDRRVLPHLERGEMKSERLELPAEILDLAPGNAREAIPA